MGNVNGHIFFSFKFLLLREARGEASRGGEGINSPLVGTGVKRQEALPSSGKTSSNSIQGLLVPSNSKRPPDTVTHATPKVRRFTTAIRDSFCTDAAVHSWNRGRRAQTRPKVESSQCLTENLFYKATVNFADSATLSFLVLEIRPSWNRSGTLNLHVDIPLHKHTWPSEITQPWWLNTKSE